MERGVRHVTGLGSDGPDGSAGTVPEPSAPDAGAAVTAPPTEASTTSATGVAATATSDNGDARERSARRSGNKRTGRVFLEWVVLVVVALAIAFLIKSFLFQAFFIPSESMTPTLQVGDRVLVNKLSYDLHDVNRGDIIVFEAPAAARSDGIEDLVKRVVGLPGDTITGDASGGVLVNGRRLDEPYLPRGTQSRFDDVPPGCGTPAGGAPGCVVPEDHLFMMGDNREASKDSRVFGPVSEDTIIGRVFVRIWPLSDVGLL